MVAISHEGDTPPSLEAARAFAGESSSSRGNGQPARRARGEEVIVATPEIETSWCHTASYTCAAAAPAALRGERIEWLADAVTAALDDPETQRLRALGLSRAQDGTGRLRRRGCSSSGKERSSRRRRIHHEQLLHGPPRRRATKPSAASCSRAKGARRSGRAARSPRSASSAAT